MGLTYADIKLINAIDLGNAKNNLIGEEEINILVDTGAYMLSINENFQKILNVAVVEKRMGQLAEGRMIEYNVAGQ